MVFVPFLSLCAQKNFEAATLMKFQDPWHDLSRDYSLFYYSGHFWGNLQVIDSFF